MTDEPFEAGPSAGATRRVRAGEVLDLLPLTHAPETIASYAERMRRGDRFPPIAVVRLAGRWVVADGHKRLQAALSLGVSELTVEVWGPTDLLRDQARQVRENAGKNARIARAALYDRAEARRLLRATFGHWRRVAASLSQLASRALRGSPLSSRQ